MIRSHTLLSLAAVGLLASAASAQTTLETFETFAGLGSGAVNLNVSALDENSIANSQGPGLVLDGCTYSSSVQLQWDGAGYYGATSQALLSNSGDGRLDLIYDSPVSSMSVDLLAFNGCADSTVVTVYDASSGLPIYTSGAISVPNASGTNFTYAAANIGKVTIQSQVWPWSTIIDNHEFGGAGGPTLSLSGSCPGASTASVTGATPGGRVAIALSAGTGSFVIPGGPCGGTVLGLAATPSLIAILTANGGGSVSISGNLPAGLCGRYLQAVDLATCTPTNVVQL